MSHGSPAWEAVAASTAIDVGTRVLDVGCGVGGFCELAVARGARVCGVDVSSDAIESARRRVPDADLRIAAMERLPWIDDAFDVVTGFNAFQYALDPEGALLEAARVVRPGGTVALCRWGPASGNDLFRLLSALRDGVEPAPRVEDDAALQIAATDAYGSLVDVGLTPRSWGAAPTTMAFPDLPALGDALRRAGAAGGAILSSDLERFAGPFRHDCGYVLRNALVYVVAGLGVKPQARGSGAGGGSR